MPTDDALATVDHDPGTDRLPVPAETPYAVGTRRVLGRCGWAVPTSIDDTQFVAAAHDASTIRDRIAATGLRGRGRGDATADGSIREGWTRARDATGDPVVVVNGNESGPNAAMDRLLVESAPLEVLDGALATAAAVGSETVVVYLPEGDEIAYNRISRPWTNLDAAREIAADVEMVVGPAEYRAGEPTMALEALEGADRIEARRRPPGPAQYGLHGRPTVVHTPRTMAQVRAALASPDDFDAAAADPGTRVLTVAGDDVPATCPSPRAHPRSGAPASGRTASSNCSATTPVRWRQPATVPVFHTRVTAGVACPVGRGANNWSRCSGRCTTGPTPTRSSVNCSA